MKNKRLLTREISPWGLLVLVVLPLFLRLAPIQHGQPDNFLPDTHVVRNALGMAKDKNLAPEAGQYSSYPNAIAYMLLPIYGAQYAIGRATGEWAGPDQYGAALKEHPWRAHLPARILCALLASLAPCFVFFALRRCGLGVGALWGAFFMATCLLHVHYSGQERPWAPLTAAMCATGWAAAAFVDSKKYAFLVLSGMLAGLAVAMHPGGLGAALMPAIAWFTVALPWQGKALKSRLFWGHVCAGTFILVALFVGYPHLLVHGKTEAGAVIMHDAIQDKTHFSLAGQTVVFGFRFETLRHLASVLLGYDPAIICLGLFGMLTALGNRAARPMVLFALIWGVFFLTNVNDHVRYLLPLAAGLTVCSGFAAERLAKFKGGRIALGCLAALTLLQAGRLAFVLQQVDTRHQIENALHSLPPGSDIAVGIGGPLLPLDATSLQRIETLRPLYSRESNRLARLKSGAIKGLTLRGLPLQNLVELDLRHHSSQLTASQAERHGTDLNAALTELGITHVLLVDNTPANLRTPLLLDELPPDRATGMHKGSDSGALPKLDALFLPSEPLIRVHSGRWESPPPSARLPLVMDFPLRDLWTVARPGPAMTLYEL